MEAIKFTPWCDLNASNGKAKQLKYRDDGACEMSIINMGVGENWEVSHTAHVTLLSGICSCVSV